MFQLESSGFRELLKKLKPDCFEDIVAAVALYRPGPLEGGMVDDFIDRKHGRKKVEYDAPAARADPRATRTASSSTRSRSCRSRQALAGYSLGGADLLRRAMGKKKAEEMAKQKAGFVDGAQGQEDRPAHRRERLRPDGEVRGLRLQPSRTRAAYGWLTYQTAYLK